MAADDTTACSTPIRQFRGDGQKSPSTAPPDASVTIQHESLPRNPARTPRTCTRAADTCREAATARGNCRANVRGKRTSIDRAEKTWTGNEMESWIQNPWAGGIKTVDVIWIDTGAGGIALCSSWGLSARSRMVLHSGTKAGPTPPSTARFLFLYLRGVGAGGALAPSR